MKKKALWVQIRDRNKKPVKKDFKRIKPRTSKRAAEEARYRREAKKFLKGTYCRVQWILNNRLEPATGIHHRNGRRGKLLMYKWWWFPVSAWGHFWIHNHPKEARGLGLLCSIGQWNVQPKEI